MTTVSLPQLPGSHLVTHSRMTCLKTCQRKHYFQYELGVRRDYEAEPLRMGSAVHEGLDALYQGKTLEEVIAAAAANYEQLPSWAQTPEQIEDWRIEREKVIRMLCGYHWRWGFEQGGVDGDIMQGAEILASEQSFEIPIRNPETGAKTPLFMLGGKIDKIVRLKDGRTAIVEHKTCSESLDAESDYWRRLRIDQQISTYWLAALELGYDVTTIIYDVIRKPEISPRAVPLIDEHGYKIVLDASGARVLNKDGTPRQSADSNKGWTLQSRRETPEEYGERFNLDIAERPGFYYARQEIPRLRADIDEFRWELWQIQQQLRDAQKADRWFRNTSECLKFGKCTYFGICTDGIDLRVGIPEGFVRVKDIHPELVAAE